MARFVDGRILHGSPPSDDDEDQTTAPADDRPVERVASTAHHATVVFDPRKRNEVLTRVVRKPDATHQIAPTHQTDMSDLSVPDLDIDALERIGTTLGSYEIKRLVGRGGMGCVYEAVHTKLGRHVALKLLKPECSRRRGAVTRFFQEARAVNRIGHPNIVDITDLVELEDGTTFIIMELLAGQTLAARMDQGPIAKPDALALFIHICDALDAAHREGFVHRDLKPDNIFLVDNGDERKTVKLLDFGVAKLLSTEADEKLTGVGVIIGTPPFMSPEQASGEHITPCSDIYSLGVVMYEVFCRQPMFRAETLPEYLDMHLNKAPVDPRHTPGAGDIDEVLRATILRCLEKKPELRYQTASELRADLTALVDESSNVALSPSMAASRQDHSIVTAKVAGQRKRFSRRRSRAWIIALLIGATLGSMTGLLMLLLDQPEDPPASATEREDGIIVEKLHEARDLRVTVHSTPQGRLFRRGESRPICRTPCDVKLRSGGTGEITELVIRRPGYQDETLRVPRDGATRQQFNRTLRRLDAKVDTEAPPRELERREQ